METGKPAPERKRILDPNDRLSEILFGLIMVLTFTGSLSAVEAGEAEVRTMLIGAIGCNLAWGLIDGIMYLMACLSERAGRRRAFHIARSADNQVDAHRAIADALPPLVAEALRPEDLERIRQHMRAQPAQPHYPRLHGHDWLGALLVLLLVFLCTFPVVLPFVFMQDAATALRVSNGIAIVMLFLVGKAFARSAGLRQWPTGMAMVLLGVVLVGITIALGG